MRNGRNHYSAIVPLLCPRKTPYYKVFARPFSKGRVLQAAYSSPRSSYLELCAARGAREGLNVADIADAGDVHNKSLEAETEACVLSAAVLAQLEVPPVVLFLESELVECALEVIEALLSLRRR